ncbi:MAG: GAF domain-containing sensor histidine kinase [Anaerolineales bacterium]|nr:GAF domain-containing sensor histidine kinase [Anaerolineales bacterium]
MSLVIKTSAPQPVLAPIRSLVESLGCESALLSGVYNESNLIGFVLGCFANRKRFSPLELDLFTSIVSSVSTLMDGNYLQEETAFRLDEVMSLQTVSSALVEKRSLDAILSVITDEAIRLLHASEALVLLIEGDGSWFQVRSRRGEGVGLASGRMLVKDSLNGLVVETGKPLVSNNVQNDSRANIDRARRLGVETVVIAPLRIRDEILGTVAVHNKRNGFFSQTDVEVLCSFANQAAIAINNAQLFGDLLSARDEVERYAQELQELCYRNMDIQEDERRRIAADIHDRVVSRLVAALYEVEACVQNHQADKNLDEQLERLRGLLDATVTVSRKCIYELWPATLEQIGLLPALRQLASRQEQVTGISHAVQVHGVTCKLKPPAKIAVYRIVQEALNNARQHAQATKIEVVLRFSSHGLRLAIQDNGKGFDVEKLMREPPRRHFGLLGMRERAVSLGGNLRIISVPKHGCRVALEIPARQLVCSDE